MIDDKKKQKNTQKTNKKHTHTCTTLVSTYVNIIKNWHIHTRAYAPIYTHTQTLTDS